MTDTDPVIQRVHHRIDETNKDLHELELKVEGHNTILHKKNGRSQKNRTEHKLLAQVGYFIYMFWIAQITTAIKITIP